MAEAVTILAKLLTVREIQEDADGATLHFQQGGQARLVLSDADYATHLRLARRSQERQHPVGVHFGEGQTVSELLRADNDVPMQLLQEGPDHVLVFFQGHDGVFHLQPDHPESGRVRAVLDEALRRKAPVWFIAQKPDLGLLDVMPAAWAETSHADGHSGEKGGTALEPTGGRSAPREIAANQRMLSSVCTPVEQEPMGTQDVQVMNSAPKPPPEAEAKFLLERNALVTIKPGIGPLPANLTNFHWRMYFSLPYPFPAKECVKQTVTVLDKPFAFEIHNHFNRVILTIRQGDAGPVYFRAVLEDKRTPAESYAGCVSFAREALQSVVIFEDMTDYPSADAAFDGAETKIGKCCEWLSGFLSACQRAAPYLTSWLVYPVSLFDVGTVYHEVTAHCADHGQRHLIASGLAISVGRQLQNPAFVMDVPQSVEGATLLDAANELLAESLMSLYRGMPRLTVLNAYTAVESLANTVFTATKVAMLLGHNVPREVAEKLVDEERERHKTEPHFLLNKGIKEASGRSLLEEDKQQYDSLLRVQKMRHSVAHTGYKPTLDEAREVHKLCCEAVRWFASVGGMPVKPMLPDAKLTFPGFSNAVKDAHARNPLELDFIRHLLNAPVSPDSIPKIEQGRSPS